MAVVVSDTSPIRALSHLGHMELLRALFGEVLVPPAVIDELERPRSSLPPLYIRGLPFVRVQSPTNRAVLDELLTFLDAGEPDAIALAMEVHAEAVLVDELAARQAAQERGLGVAGAIAVLVRAKRLGLVDAVKPQLDRLKAELGFFVSARLRAEALRQAGE